MEPTRHDTSGQANPAVQRALAVYWQRLDEADGASRDEIRRQILDEFPELARELREMFAAEEGLTAERSRPSKPRKLDVDDTCESVLKRLTSSGLVSPRRAEELQTEIAAGQFTEPKQFLDELLKRKLITRWQLEELNAGRTEFLLENGRYLLLQKIGQGGMGAVYRARHTRMKREVALKLIDPRRAEDPALLDRFRREVAVCSQLEHEHIVRTHDVGEHDGALFLVMEYVRGSDLASLVRRDGPMSPGEAAAIGVQVAAGLAYAHAKGIVHRDIKPSNILLSTAGSAKVLDMGLARITEDPDDATITELTQDGTVMGTVDFMSPEQARDSRSVDARSDIYSLGAALYFLLCSRPPYPGGNTIEKLNRLANEAPPPLGQIRPDCPRELDAAIQQMMAKSPEDRFQSAEDVVRVLKPLAVDRLAGRPVVTTAVQTAAETHRETVYQAPGETLPVVAAEETLYSTMQRRRAESSRQKWIAGGGLATVLAVIAILSVLRPESEEVLDPSPTGEPPPAHPAPEDVRVEFPGHFGDVTALAWSPDGQWLASGGADGLCRIWNPENGRTEAIYRGHHSAVYGLTWSDDSKWIASGEMRSEVHIWDFSGQRLIEPIRTPGNFDMHAHYARRMIDLSPDKTRLAYGLATAATTGVYDISAAHHVWSDPVRCTMVSFSPEGDRLAGSVKYGDVVVWDAASGERVFVSPPDPDWNSIAWRRDGNLIISTDTALNVWDVDANELVDSITLPAGKTKGIAPEERLWFSLSGNRCLVIDSDENLFLTVDLESGETIHRSEQLSLVPTSTMVALSPDLRRCADGGINVRNVEDGTVQLAVASKQSIPECRGVTILADRYLQARLLQQVGLAWQSFVKTWDLQTGELVSGFPEVAHVDQQGRIRGVRNDRVVGFRREGSRAAADNRVLATLAPAPEPTNGDFPAVRWSDDGAHIYSDNRFLATSEFRLWDAATGELVTEIDLDQEMWDETLNPNGLGNPQYLDGRLATKQPYLDIGPQLNEDASVLVRAYYVTGTQNRGTDVIRTWRTPWDRVAAEFPTGFDHYFHKGAVQMGVSHDGQFLAANAYGGPEEIGTTVIFDLQSGERVVELETGIPVVPVCYSFSPNDEYLLTAGQVWDWRDRKKLWECPERDQAIGVNNINYRGGALFSDDRHVVIAQDGQHQIWDWRESRKRATLFLVPDQDGYAFFNHETGHWTGTPQARQYLRLGHPDEEGDIQWLRPHRYREITGWENDESRAGLDFARSGKADAARTASPFNPTG